jgi:hypothetical protein
MVQEHLRSILPTRIKKYQASVLRVLLVLLLLLPSACSHPFLQIAVKELPAYEALFQRTEGWTGGDGIFSVRLDSDRTLWLFGDTFIGEVKGGRHIDPLLVNNTLAIQKGLEPDKAEIKFFYRSAADGKPEAFMQPPDGVGWLWPYHGLRTPDGLFLFQVQVDRSEGPPGFDFKPVATWLIHISNPDDSPDQWKLSSNKIPWSREDRLFGSSVLAVGDECLIYGTEEKVVSGFSEKKMFLARVPVSRLKDFCQWRFFSRGEWVPNPEGAEMLLANMANEFSVSFQPALNQYVLVYTQDSLSEFIVLRLAREPWGPWSEPIRVYRCPEATWDPRAFCYAAKGHPELSRSSEELIVTYTTNSSDFELVESDTRFYRPRFLKIRFQ